MLDGGSPASDLKRACLSYSEVLAQSVSVIAPSTVPAAVIGLIFATAGNGTWLSFLLGMVGLMIVGHNVNQFARRSASSGSLYTYIVKGLGPTAGVMSGWALLFAYTLTGMSTLCGFGIISQQMLAQVGVHLPILAVYAIGTVIAAYVAFRDIQLSARFMLVFEGCALVAVLLLGVLVWRHHHFALDAAQVKLTGVHPGGVLQGIVLVVFGFSGFESSTSLGQEARNPLIMIPRSVSHSVVISGLVFIFMAYVVVLGFGAQSASLGKTEAPLYYLAHLLGQDWLGVLINLGIILSFFSCTLAAINSTARIAFSMSRHGLFYGSLGEAHRTNETPYIAVIMSAIIIFLVPVGMEVFHLSPFDSQGYLGSLCSFGFIVVYIMISIAAPIFLRARGDYSRRAIIYSIAGVGFMMLPLLGAVGWPGSKLFPPPGGANDILLLVFVGYMAVGFGWLAVERVRRPRMIKTMTNAIGEFDLKFSRETSG